jgi:hypothetical protein
MGKKIVGRVTEWSNLGRLLLRCTLIEQGGLAEADNAMPPGGGILRELGCVARPLSA